MRFEYYPEDIADAIAPKAGEDGEKNLAEVVEALCDLKALCENENNRDSWRALYRMLEKLTAVLQYEERFGIRK